jgi:hypothetical protein
MILNTNTPNNSVKMHEVKSDRMPRRNTVGYIILGNINTLLLEMDRSSSQKVRKDIVELKNTIN